MRRLLLLALLAILACVGVAEATSPAIATSTSGAEGADTSSHTVNYPASCCSAGDLVVVEINCSNSTKTITTPGTFTELFNRTTRGAATGPGCGANGNAADSCHVIAYQIANGSEGASVTFTTSATNRCVYVSRRITGAHASAAPEATINPLVASTNGNPNPPSITPSWGAADNLYIAGFASIGSADAVSAYPTNYTDSQFNKNANAASMGSASRQVTNSTTEDPGTYTISPNQVWTAYTIAVRPAAADAGVIGGGVGPSSGIIQ